MPLHSCSQANELFSYNCLWQGVCSHCARGIDAYSVSQAAGSNSLEKRRRFVHPRRTHSTKNVKQIGTVMLELTSPNGEEPKKIDKYFHQLL
jgi:hypothetical protein